MGDRASKILLTILGLGLLLGAGTACAQAAQVTFHWAPSPTVSQAGLPLSPAVEYEVYVVRDGADPLLVATVADTVYTLSVEPGVVHRLGVRGLDAAGRASQMSVLSEAVYEELEVERGDAPPASGALGANYPNPFNPETRIVYGVPENLPAGTPMALEIYNLAGRRVRTMEVDETPGWHEVLWNGTDDSGRNAPTGMYVTRFACGDHVETHKMTMLK